MVIDESAIKIINMSVGNITFETGGILGSSDGKVVTDVIIDKNERHPHACSYIPNVDFLNSSLYDWLLEGKRFMGIFHTHFCGVRTLSPADKKYIYDIMASMPREINKLFFPVFVLPNRELICYKAIKRKDGISIESETLQIVEKGGELDEN